MLKVKCNFVLDTDAGYIWNIPILFNGQVDGNG